MEKLTKVFCHGKMALIHRKGAAPWKRKQSAPKKGRAAVRIASKALCAIISVFLLLNLPLAHGLGEAHPALDAEIYGALKRYNNAGAAVLAAKDGEIVYEYYYGSAYIKNGTPVTADTYFCIASVTKMVSAIRVMQLVEEGKLDLDTDISKYLGYTIRNPYHKKTPITLRMLMTHTASLREEGDYLDSSNGLRFMLDQKKKRRGNFYNETPGSVYRYSNFGAGIMGSLIEAVTGENVNDAVREGVFDPLGIDAAYHVSLLADQEHLAAQYKSDGVTPYKAPSKYMSMPWDSGVNPDMHYRITVGSLWIRPYDLCRLGMLLCDLGELDGVRLLQEDTVKEMMASQQGRNKITAKTIYGLCVNRVESLLEGKTVYGHQGMQNASLCNVYFDPETRFVFVLASNGCNSNMREHIANIARKCFSLTWQEFAAK